MPGFGDHRAPPEEVLAGEFADAAEGARSVVNLKAEAAVGKDSRVGASGGAAAEKGGSSASGISQVASAQPLPSWTEGGMQRVHRWHDFSFDGTTANLGGKVALRKECRGENAAEDCSGEVAGDSAEPVEVGGRYGGEVDRERAECFLYSEACMVWY